MTRTILLGKDADKLAAAVAWEPFQCLRKENPSKEWIQSADSLRPAGYRVLYATTSLYCVAVLDCPPTVPAATWGRVPDSNPKRRPQSAAYHLVTPAFYHWALGGLRRLGAATEARREKVRAEAAARRQRDPDAIAPDPELAGQMAGEQLRIGIERWEVVVAWAERFMRGETLAAAGELPVKEPPRLPPVPSEAALDRLAWVDIETWALEA